MTLLWQIGTSCNPTKPFQTYHDKLMSVGFGSVAKEEPQFSHEYKVILP